MYGKSLSKSLVLLLFEFLLLKSVSVGMHNILLGISTDFFDSNVKTKTKIQNM